MWFAVLSSKEVEKKPVGVRRLGKDIVFWRDSKGKVQVLEDFCVHRRPRLSAGKVVW
ncbi:Rieske 2Fe-2S domain-containing protein [Thermococcus sp. 2319x1]|uniref:Rieske 2Fe-2S domain-containing protein n=1 Tax=Thermococcus sp. 2319x1 TaxID=1674923 RepID=UPI0015829253|nr:Rieske (2Fe-2S) protein [Thermococcus sp. 2319x1]